MMISDKTVIIDEDIHAKIWVESRRRGIKFGDAVDYFLRLGYDSVTGETEAAIGTKTDLRFWKKDNKDISV
jgi:hypothetical protein